MADVAVWLQAKSGQKPNSMDEREPEQPPSAQMDQRDHEFVPRVLAVRSGQPVEFTNSDPANHNVRTSSSQRFNEFNIFTGMDGTYTHRFAVDARGRPVRVGCDIHPWMRGWIYVFDHPWFAVTDERGGFRIDGVPPGDYVLMVRQPDIRYRHDRPITVTGGAPTRVEIEVKAEEESEAASDSIQ
jgi:plastocyanin